jgi:hypothetical protein
MRIAGVLLILIGLVWMLQGVGILPGSVMTGQVFWFWMGLLSVAAGVGAIVVTSRRASPRR